MVAATASDFQHALEDGDRWLEIVAGRLVRLCPPDERHGNVVRNLAKVLSHFLRKHPTLYPCYEIGLVVARDPDTVRCPALSAFPLATGLKLADQLLTATRPELIVEVASSNDRREAMSDRIRGYRDWGVPALWIFDPETQHAHIFHREETPRMLKPIETLHGQFELAGFHVAVGELFEDPEWARPKVVEEAAEG